MSASRASGGRARPLARRLAALAVTCASFAFLSTGCASTVEKKQAAIYGPSASVLEVVAVLRRHVPDDTYRFPPATDFTGRNVYRASLLRLENIERIHGESLRAGHLDGVLGFSKARAFERLRGYKLAADYYRAAAKRDATLQDEALRSAEACERIAAALAVGVELGDPLSPQAPIYVAAEAEQVVAQLDERRALLMAAVPEDPASHYRGIVREELERADVTRAHWFAAMRFAIENGQVRAIAEQQRVAQQHAASHRHLGHLLDLANLYATLASEYVAAVPPESMAFDPPHLRELADAATQLYQRVAARGWRP